MARGADGKESCHRFPRIGTDKNLPRIVADKRGSALEKGEFVRRFLKTGFIRFPDP